MRQLLAVASVILLLGLTACTSAYSVFVDARPKESAASISQRLGVRYPSIGFERDSYAAASTQFSLGSWYSRGSAGIHHAEREGVLWIWITPPPGSDVAASIVEEVKRIISEIAPEVSVRIVESRSPDLR
jgi:hypothetical protein